jgi:hypothetical protein
LAVQPPSWAEELVKQVYIDEGRNDVPALGWRVTYHKSSSGRAYLAENRISITAGQDPVDQKLTVLHECAHQLTKQGHTSEFWDKAWELFHRYQVPVPRALKRSGDYKKKAISAYYRSRAKLEAEEADLDTIPTTLELDPPPPDEGSQAEPTPGNLVPLAWGDAQGQSLNTNSSMDSGSIWAHGQLTFLEGSAPKLYLCLIDKRQQVIITNDNRLIKETKITRTYLYKALALLEEFKLIERIPEKDSGGHNAGGITIRLLPPSAKLPWQASQYQRKKIVDEIQKHQDAIDKLNMELLELSKLTSADISKLAEGAG